MVITQEELKKKFQGSSFIVGSRVIEHVCGGDYVIYTHYNNGNTFIVSATPYPDFGILIDNSFLSNFNYTKLLSLIIPKSKYVFTLFRVYELKGWR